MKDFPKLLPWLIIVALVSFHFGGGFKKSVVPSPTPTPVAVDNKLEDLLCKEDAMFLSAYIDNLCLYIEADTELLKNTKDIEKLVHNSGVVVNLGREQKFQLGDVVSSYFDEEKEFPQLQSDLTPEKRAMAVACWKKFKEDLDKVQK